MEIEDIKATLDLLIARTHAQEMALMYLARLQPADFYRPPLLSEVGHMRDSLRSSSLTDAQLGIVDSEIQRISRMLVQELPKKPDPWGDLPF